MCKDSAAPMDAACDVPDSQLEVKCGMWRLKVAAHAGSPNVDLSASAVRLQVDNDGDVAPTFVLVPVPEQAQPLDVDKARCIFSRKRQELIVEWPKQSKDSNGSPSSLTTDDAASTNLVESSTLAEVPSEAGVALEKPGNEAEVANHTLPENMAKDVPAAPQQADAVGVSGDEWKARGNAAVKSGDLEEAVRCYSHGIAANGDEALLCSNRALCFSKLGRHEQAFEDAKRCVGLRPEFFKGFLRGAMALRAMGRPEEALAFLKRCPPHDEASSLAAEIRPEAEKAEAARIDALCGAEKSKEEGNVLFRKGLFEIAATKYSEALSQCEDQESAMALAIRNNRAACFHQISDFHSVIKDASYVLERDPSNVKALMRRMLALEPLERYEAALEDARNVLLQDHRNEAANKVQHRLSKLVRDLKKAAGA